MKYLAIAALAAIGAIGAPQAAIAGPVTLNFEGIAPYPNPFTVLILDYYNGGTSSVGSTGTNYGISFDSKAHLLCLTSMTVGCSNTSRGGVGDPGSAQGALGFGDIGSKYLNVASGFEGAISFEYAALADNGSVSVYSGLNGTGTLLGSIDLPSNATGCPDYSGADFCPFSSLSLAFSGVARSVSFNSDGLQFAVDDLTFRNVLSPVPEPASWGLMMLGVGAVGGQLRRRRTAPAFA
jgi:hypothetical protein